MLPCWWCYEDAVGGGSLSDDGGWVNFCDEHYGEYRTSIGAPSQGGSKGAPMDAGEGSVRDGR